MEIDEQKLTPRERQYLEHVGRAKERGISLVEYCAELGIKPRALYSTRRDMVAKGLLARVRLSPKRESKKSSRKFVAVRLSGRTSPVQENSRLLCRVRHPSGCVLELGEWPEATWMSKVLRGDSDA